MDLKFRKASPNTQMAMSKVACGEDLEDYHKLAEEKIADLNNHDHASLVNSGNSSILSVMNAIDGAILIPDQGAWNGFKQIAKFLNKDLITVRTNKGLIETEFLHDALEENKNRIDFEDEDNKSALFLTSFAAYTAEQEISEISKFLHDENMLLVEDASGAISDNKLADGRYSDIIMASTGSPKIVNVGDGGFVSTNDKSIFEKSRLLFKSFKTSNMTACGIYTELDYAFDNLNKSLKATEYIKNSLEDDFNIFHLDKRGINLIIQSDNPKKFSYDLRQELILDNHGMISKCPNYNRLKEKAVAIEIKNLDVSSLEKDNSDAIVDKIRNCK